MTHLPRSGATRLLAPLLLLLAVALPLAGQEVDPDLLAGMRIRSIGPAGMSGRVTAIDVFPGDPDLVWIGTATGGVWKSTDGGTTLEPVFDEQPVLGIGAVAVDPLYPDVVWVGPGEGNPRNSAGVGAGVYRTDDGGESWTLLGLEASERIHRIVLHPENPDVAWVGAMGPAWSDGTQRGVYRTLDGGVTWERVLFVNARTGVSDLVIDPSNPDRLWAGMWEFRRRPWFFESGGPGSGLYRSEDGGTTWTRLEAADGLPEGELGRIGLSVHRADPRVVYALVEAAESALLRSEDGGRSWERIEATGRVNPRPFYYTDIRVDPRDPDRIYNLHGRLQRSDDGGVSWRTLSRGVHPDFHALWIDPVDPERLWAGTDGGVYVSHDGGDDWRMLDNLPVGQFYHVSVDMETPFNIYGGMQDNGSWRGPSNRWDAQGIRNGHWREIAFGDGFNTVVAPDDARFGYGMSQGGNLYRLDFRTGERKPIRPWAPDGVELRFNWNAALATDPYDRGTIFYGSQFVHRSRDRGNSWQIISPDLTTNNPEWQRQDESGGLTRDATGAENFTSILSIAPSAIQQGVIWVGTDDGKVQVTRAGGGTWDDLTERIPGAVPPNTWVPHIEVSRFRPDAAFVTFDDHRRGNWEPLAFAVYDYGRVWQRIVDGDDVRGFVHTLEQDPVVEDLLYLGTEFGLWISLDRGDHWIRWRNGLPAVPVRSLVVHRRDGDLVVGTHGRALWVLDDVRPLRELSRSPDLRARAAHVFEAPPAVLHTADGLDGYHFPAQHFFEGRTRPDGALVSYWLAEASEDVRLEIYDVEDTLVRTLEVPGDAGLNRTSWDLREDLPVEYRARGVPEGDGPAVLPGRYRLRLVVGDVEATGSVEVVPDPRVDIPPVERVAKRRAVLQAAILQARLRELVWTRRRIEEAVRGVTEQIGPEGDPGLANAAGELLDRLDAAARNPELDDYMRTVRGLDESLDAPTEGQRIDLQRATEALDRMIRTVDDIIVLDVARFRDLARGGGYEVFEEIRMIEGGR